MEVSFDRRGGCFLASVIISVFKERACSLACNLLKSVARESPEAFHSAHFRTNRLLQTAHLLSLVCVYVSFRRDRDVTVRN
jgi:hypothetical protein